jgi:hypothetical protein
MCQTRNDNRKEKKVVATPAVATSAATSEFQEPKRRRGKSYAKAVNPSANASTAPANKSGRKFKDGETITRGKKNAGKPKPATTNA